MCWCAAVIEGVLLSHFVLSFMFSSHVKFEVAGAWVGALLELGGFIPVCLFFPPFPPLTFQRLINATINSGGVFVIKTIYSIRINTNINAVRWFEGYIEKNTGLAAELVSHSTHSTDLFYSIST